MFFCTLKKIVPKKKVELGMFTHEGKIVDNMNIN
jgi:hypothetical protein